MAIATISVDLEEFGMSMDNEEPKVIAENFLDLLAARREELNGQIVRVDVGGDLTDVNLEEGTETPVA